MKILTAVLFAAFVLGISSTAHADFNICNRTDDTVFASIASQDDRGDWVARGWWEIRPQACRTIAAGTAQENQYFVHAFTDTLSSFWTEGASTRMFCTTNETFERRQNGLCDTARGWVVRQFFLVNIGPRGTDYTLELSDRLLQ